MPQTSDYLLPPSVTDWLLEATNGYQGKQMMSQSFILLLAGSANFKITFVFWTFKLLDIPYFAASCFISI